MPSLYISYRREAASETTYAARLQERLIAVLGEKNVTLGFDPSDPDPDFQANARALLGADAVLALIGPQWGTVPGWFGRPRTDNPDGFVREEIETALSQHIPVIPVLVGGAELPNAGSLPQEIRAFLNHQAIRLRNDQWTT